jgi:hypothetical protein
MWPPASGRGGLRCAHAGAPRTGIRRGSVCSGRTPAGLDPNGSPQNKAGPRPAGATGPFHLAPADRGDFPGTAAPGPERGPTPVRLSPPGLQEASGRPELRQGGRDTLHPILPPQTVRSRSRPARGQWGYCMEVWRSGDRLFARAVAGVLPPPCGEGWGGGVCRGKAVRWPRRASAVLDAARAPGEPPPLPPPRKGEGDEVARPVKNPPHAAQFSPTAPLRGEGPAGGEGLPSPQSWRYSRGASATASSITAIPLIPKAT